MFSLLCLYQYASNYSNFVGFPSSDAPAFHLSLVIASSSAEMLMNCSEQICSSTQNSNSNINGPSFTIETSLKIRSITISSKEIIASSDNQPVSSSYINEVSIDGATVNSTEYSSYDHSLQISSSHKDIQTENELTISDLSDNQKISKSNTPILQSKSFSNTYLWIVEDEEVGSHTSTNQFLSTNISTYEIDNQISTGQSNIEMPLDNTLSSFMKQNSKQGAMYATSLSETKINQFLSTSISAYKIDNQISTGHSNIEMSLDDTLSSFIKQHDKQETIDAISISTTETNPFLFTSDKAYKIDNQISTRHSNIELSLGDTLSSSIKQHSKQETMDTISITATEIGANSTKTPSASSITMQAISTSAILNITTIPALHSGNIWNFVSSFPNKNYKLNVKDKFKSISLEHFDFLT